MQHSPVAQSIQNSYTSYSSALKRLLPLYPDIQLLQLTIAHCNTKIIAKFLAAIKGIYIKLWHKHKDSDVEILSLISWLTGCNEGCHRCNKWQYMYMTVCSKTSDSSAGIWTSFSQIKYIECIVVVRTRDIWYPVNWKYTFMSCTHCTGTKKISESAVF